MTSARLSVCVAWNGIRGIFTDSLNYMGCLVWVNGREMRRFFIVPHPDLKSEILVPPTGRIMDLKMNVAEIHLHMK